MRRSRSASAAAAGPRPSTVGCSLSKTASHRSRLDQPGGRPHAEAVALEEAGAARAARPSMSRSSLARMTARAAPPARPVIAAGVARVVIAVGDPDPRTAAPASRGCRPRDRGRNRASRRRRPKRAWPASSAGSARAAVRHAEAGHVDRRQIALPSGESKWITGEDARAHVHLERARADMILVGRGTYAAERPARRPPAGPGGSRAAPRLADARRSVEGWTRLAKPREISRLGDVDDLLVEGGAGAAPPSSPPIWSIGCSSIARRS